MFPDAESSHLCLGHPTPNEMIAISTDTAEEWQDSLFMSKYLEESQVMANAPLASYGGMTNWILVDDRDDPDARQILSSCETFRKRALLSDIDGGVTHVFVHGVASVFCSSQYRNRGYPKRMMRELAKQLQTWQAGNLRRIIGSILYSDIGKEYYTKLGWQFRTSNMHIEIKPGSSSQTPLSRLLLSSDLPTLCEQDEARLRKTIATSAKALNIPCFAIVPDLNHFGWHFAKEKFACNYLFNRSPQAKGAIAGPTGNQVWVVWTHRYYNNPSTKTSNNILYILRLVMEADESGVHQPEITRERLPQEKYDEQMRYLEAVIRAAQQEAFEWKLDAIHLWDPSPLVVKMLQHMNVVDRVVERGNSSIASALWYNEDGGVSSDFGPLWLNNEHYAWC
jgi:hypothetical protein